MRSRIVDAIRGQKRNAAYELLVSGRHEDGRPTSEGTDFDSMGAGGFYAKLATVYAGIFAITSAVASVPIRVFRNPQDPEEIPEHDLIQRLKNPNDNDTGYDLIEELASFLEIAGRAHLLLEGPGVENFSPPKELTPLRPYRVKPIADSKLLVGGYEYRVNDKVTRFERNEVFTIKYFSPLHDFMGQGSVEPATLAALTDLWAIGYNKGFFKRGATLSGILSTEANLDSITMHRLVEDFRQQYTGSEKAWQVKGLTDGLKFQALTPTHKDMLFENLRQMNREEILMALGVPPVMVTLLDGATYANAQEQKRQFWETTVLPKLRKLAARINKDLAARYPDNVFVVFDTSDVPALQSDRQAIVTAGVQMLERRSLTPNELRIWVATGEVPQLDALPGGDMPLTTFNLMPADDTGTGGGGDQGGTPDPSQQESAPETPSQAVERLIRQMHETGARVKVAARRESIWRQFDARTRAFEKVFARAARAMFAEQLEFVLENLEETLARATPMNPTLEWDFALRRGVDEIELLLEQLKNDNVDRFRNVYQAAVEKAGTGALADLGIGELDFSIVNPSVLEFLEREGAELVKNVDAFTQKRLANTLAEGIASGENALDLSDRVRGVLGPDASRARANTIGRTESIKSFNFGAQEAYLQTEGLVDRKRWLATLDSEVRDTHAEADGDTVEINGFFEVGNSHLRYPGDPGGDAEEVINCRCTIEPILQGEPADVGLAYSTRGVSNNGHHPTAEPAKT